MTDPLFDQYDSEARQQEREEDVSGEVRMLMVLVFLIYGALMGAMIVGLVWWLS